MHKRITFLCFPLALSTCCFGQGGSAIVRPDAPQPGFSPAFPKYVKLVEGFAPSVEKSPVWLPTRGKAVAARRNLAATGIKCGHIAVIPVSPDVDPNMIVRLPDRSAAKMPIYEGLPACPDDVRLPTPSHRQ